MYLLLIYILIIFFMILLDKKSLKEGFVSYKYDEFQLIRKDNELTDKDKKKIDDYKTDKNILYDKILKETLKQEGADKTDKEIYANYIKNYIKFNNIKKQQSKIEYSDEQKALFKDKYEPRIITSNESNYIDKKYLSEEYLSKKSEEIDYDLLKGELPGYIDPLNGQIINNIINKNDDDKEIEIKDKHLCCDHSRLNIQGNDLPILFGEALAHSNRALKKKPDDPPKDDDLNAYNYPYYKYMGIGDKLYDSLYLYYNKTKEIGSINLDDTI